MNIFQKIYLFFTTRDCNNCKTILHSGKDSMPVGSNPSSIVEWTCPNCKLSFIEDESYP